jgi:hypothetical protein
MNEKPASPRRPRTETHGASMGLSRSLVILGASLAQLGCVNSYLYAPTERAAREISPDVARDTIRRVFSSCGAFTEVTFYPDHFTTVFQNGAGEARYYYKDIDDVRMRYLARLGPDHADVGLRLRLVNTAMSKELEDVAVSCDVTGPFPAGYDARLIADALLRLKLDYDARYGAESTSAFRRLAASWHSGELPPSLPGEIGGLHSLAKAAVNEKNFVTAAERYDRAVSLAPWWADGHFNEALVLGELDAVDAAAVEMQRTCISARQARATLSRRRRSPSGPRRPFPSTGRPPRASRACRRSSRFRSTGTSNTSTTRRTATGDSSAPGSRCRYGRPGAGSTCRRPSGCITRGAIRGDREGEFAAVPRIRDRHILDRLGRPADRR